MKTAPSRVAFALAITLAVPSSALAQSPEATALFAQGKKLLDEGDVAAACEKFEASDALDRQVGTELNLADCRERNGQTASAWAMFVKAAATAKRRHDPREDVAKTRAHALEKHLVKLTIRVPQDSDIDGLVIKRNDTPIPRGGWNDAVPVDPAEYTITAEAPGRKDWSETVVVKTKDKVVEVPELVRAPRARHRVRDTVEATEHPELPNQNRGLAIVLAGFGVGASVIATGFALYSQNAETHADELCPMTACADPRGIDYNRTARLDGWIANIGWVIGGASLAGAGVAWWLGKPSDRDDSVSIVPVIGGDRAGLAIGGRF